MTSLTVIGARHIMVSRRLVARNGKKWVCCRATPHGHNFHQKGRECGVVAAVRWLVFAEVPR